MAFIELWKMLNVGLIVDWEKKLATVKLGPITLEQIPLPRVRSLEARTQELERVLSDLFIKPRVMWRDLTAEKTGPVADSLRVLSADAERSAAHFATDDVSMGREISSLLRAWSNSALLAAKAIEDALREENDPIEAGIDSSARPTMNQELVRLRLETYPTVEFLATVLDQGSLVRQQALSKLAEGRDVLAGRYSVAGSKLPSATAVI